MRLRREVVPQRREGSGRAVAGGPDDSGDGVERRVGVPHRREVDEVEAVGPPLGLLGGGLQREPRLADATRPEQGHEAHGGIGEEVADHPELRVTPHELRRLRRQVRGAVGQRRQRREVALEAGMGDLEDPFRLQQVLQPVLTEVDQRHLLRQSTIGEVGGARRDEHLAAVAGGGDLAARCTSTPT